MKFTSLTGRFALWFIVVTLLPLASFGYLSLRQNEDALRGEALGRMSRLADRKVLQIKAYLAERIQDVELLARSNLAEAAMAELSRTYGRHGANSAEYHRAAKPFDRNFAVYIGEDDDKLFYDVFLITPQGEIIYTNKHESDFTTNLLDGPWRDSQLAKVFRESRMTLESSVSDFEHYAPSNEPAAFVSAPVIRDGRLLGVVAFQLDTQRIYQVAGNKIGLGVTGETTLAKLTRVDEAIFVAPLRHDPQAAMRRKIDLKTSTIPMRNALSGERGSGVEIDYDGKRAVAAWRYLSELRWGMVVKMDADEVFAPLYQQRKNLLEALLGLMLFAGVVAFYFGRKLVVPLKSLAASADEIAQGDFNKRVDETRADEVGMLGRAFNRMAKNLQALYRTLEERVEERTRDLNVTNEQLQEEIIEREHIEMALRDSQEAAMRTLDELRRKEAVLQRSETRLRTLYDTTSDAIMMLDDKGFFDCNNATLAMFGCATKEEFCSKHPADLSPQQQPCGTDSMTLANRRIATAMEQGTHRFEWLHRRADNGQNFPADVLLNRMDLDGKTVLQATVRDITARKQVEAALQMTRIGVDRSSDSLFWITSDARIIDVNEAPCRALGYTREELLRLTVADIDVNYKAEMWPQHFDDLSKKGSLKFESTQRAKDGHLIPVEIAANYFKIGGGEYNFSVVRDITERKQTEEILKRHKQVLGITSDGFWLTDAMGNLQVANQAYADISGYSVEELTQMHISQLEAKEQSIEEVKAHIAKIIATGSDAFETRHRHKDGHEIDIEVTTSFLPESQQFAAFLRDITERKRIENELKNSRDQYDRLTTNIPIGVYLLRTTASGKFFFKYVSARFCAMLGATAASIYADSGVAFQAIHPDDLPNFIELNRVAVQAREPFLWDGRSLVGGVTKWLHIESRPEPLGNGDCIWDGVMVDITERKLAQLDLQHNQDLLNTAQRLGKLGSWELDLVSDELRWSDEIYRIFEIDPARFSPSYENFLNMIHPDDRDRVNQAYTQSLENRQPYDVVHRLLLADGRIKWVREHCTSEFDVSGKPLRSVGAVQDITEEHLAKEQLRVAAATFETHEAIMITDAKANIIRVNQAFQHITGYSPEEVLGKNPRILSSGRQDKAFYADMWQQLLGAGSWTGEMWDRRKGGQVYPKWLTITAVKNEQGETTEYVAIFSDITARKQAEEEIRSLAFYDALTRLPNRRLLLDRFHLALSLSARNDHYGAVLFLDMDRFKTLNDTLGHDYGDLLLVEVAQRIQACVREVDTVSRLGGDEFVVLLEEVDTGAEQASQKVALIAEKIRAALAAPYQLKDNEHHSSPSIGVCLYRGNAESVDDLLKHADMAMYQAKDAGRNAVRFFDPAMQLAVETRAAIEADLRRAVPDKQLRLYYQIQLDSDQRPLGAEALVRWNHPKRGMVSPAQFIPIAEESSLILDIGHWVMETACRQLKEWGKREQTRHLELAVNVSAQQFRLQGFVDTVAAMVRIHQVIPACLKLELTESVVLADVADVVAKMHALKALGIKLSLDDFGTGYSSLSYLKQLPLDQIKIDQSFVRDIATDPNDAVMVKTIIGMAQNFRLNVIAEGVETEAQLNFLQQNGCMAYQGYLFGKPMPIGEFEALLGKD